MLDLRHINDSNNNQLEQNYSSSSFQNEKQQQKIFQNKQLADLPRFRETVNEEVKSNFYPKYNENTKKDVFNLTYFKQKRNQMTDKNFYNSRLTQQNPKISLQKIQQKIRKYVIIPISTKSNDNKAQYDRSIQIFRKTDHSRSNSLSSSVYIPNHQKTEPPHNEPIYLQPLTLKKKLNLIKKQKDTLKEQLLTNESVLKHEERNLEKSWRSLSFYKTKLDKINVIRQIHNKQREENQKQRSLHQQLIRCEKIRLKQSIVGTRSNLSMSKLSVYEQKKNIATVIRKESRLMTEQIKNKDKMDIQRKKNTKDCIKICEKIWLDSVRQWKEDKKLSINQKKLQQITVEISSLEKQNNINETFYRQKKSNNHYRNRIKDKKMQIQKKLKQYKKNLMIELNQEQMIRLSENEEDLMNLPSVQETKQMTMRNKRLSVISTEPDQMDHSHESLKFRNSMITSKRT